MVVKRRLRSRGDSSESNSDLPGIRNNGQPLPSSPLRRMHDDEVSGMEAKLRRTKQPKTTTTTTPMSSTVSKMSWTKNDELIILASIVDYEKDTKLRYNSDWDALYGYIKGPMAANFSKTELKDKIRSLKKRFTDNQARSSHGKGLSFTNTDDDEIFKLSVIIWDTNETESGSNENIDQDKVLGFNKDDENVEQEKVLGFNKDVPCAEHENEGVGENVDQEKDATYAEHERVDENMGQEEDLHFNNDVPFAEHERVGENMDQDEEDVASQEHERVDENVDQDEEDVASQEHGGVNENVDQENADVPEADTEDEPVSGITMEIGKGDEKEKSLEDGVLKETLEGFTWFPRLAKYQQNLMLQNLKNLGAQRKRELIDEWKALFSEEMQLEVKKLRFVAKVASAGLSD